MIKDLLYYFDEKFVRHELGEIQTSFNQSFVTDGTKDSCKMVVINFQKLEFMPYTIVWHKSTNTWWIVGHDKVTRYTNENGTYIYKHELNLLGAVELLNARDLTDCGFYANQYEFGNYIQRLLNLSTFEFKNNYEFTERSYRHCKDFGKIVDYTKAFENYTLLSALREIFDGLNMSVKMYFEQSNDTSITDLPSTQYKIIKAIFDIVPKNGFSYLSPLTEDAFNDTRETRTIDKNSYGTSVISNAENVSSTQSRTYPSTGFAYLGSDGFYITKDIAKLKLPSAIDRVNWLQLIIPVGVVFNLPSASATLFTSTYDIPTLKTQIRNFINTQFAGQPIAYKDILLRNLDYYVRHIYNAMSIKLYSAESFNPSTMVFERTDNKQVSFIVRYNYPHESDTRRFVYFAEKSLSVYSPSAPFTISWKRGENFLTSFAWFGDGSNQTQLASYYWTDYKNTNPYLLIQQYGSETIQVKLTSLPEDGANISVNQVMFRVNYVPMTDLKIKYDNDGVSRNSQVYNQTGKMTDGFALSKQLLSYAKTIESDNQTKFGVYYKESDVPELGRLVMIDNVLYTIDSVSKTYYQNESYEEDTQIDYYIECEFSLSRSVAVKSLLVNPDSNIRAYGIPQNYNVKRQQLFRDFYQLDLYKDENSQINWLSPLPDLLNVGLEPIKTFSHKAFIKTWWYANGYKGETTIAAINAVAPLYLLNGTIYKISQGEDGTLTLGDLSVVGGDVVIWNGTNQVWEIYDNDDYDTYLSTYYYQLDTSTVVLKKAIYEVVDFKDNNIIGYDFQTPSTGFSIVELFDANKYMVINVPITYVKDDGSCIGYDIGFVNTDNLEKLYSSFGNAYHGAYNALELSQRIQTRVFIPDFMWNPVYTSHTQYAYSGTFTGIPSEIDVGDLFSGVTLLAQDRMQLYGFQIVYADTNKNVIEDSSRQYVNYQILRNQQTNRVYVAIDTNIETTREVVVSWTDYRTYTYQGIERSSDFVLKLPNYEKDPIEVPVMEYCCQLENTNNVIIGENIFINKEEDMLYCYHFQFLAKNIINEENFETRNDASAYPPVGYRNTTDNTRTIRNGKSAIIKVENDKVFITLWQNTVTDFNTKEIITVDNNQEFQKYNDLAIVRYAIRKDQFVDNKYVDFTDFHTDLMFIVRNLDKANIYNDPNNNNAETLELAINYYKVE